MPNYKTIRFRIRKKIKADNYFPFSRWGDKAFPRKTEPTKQGEEQTGRRRTRNQEYS